MNQLQKGIPETKSFFPNLDGIRFLAFLLVYLSHSLSPTISRIDKNETFVNLFKLHSLGGFGVSMFFVLSGFLISYLLLKEKDKNGKINLGYFYMRRLLRIWPLYFAVVIFGLYIFPFIKMHVGTNQLMPVRNGLYYLFFLGNFDVINAWHLKEDISLMVAISWSVAIEEQFYLVWPLLFLFLPRQQYRYIFLTIIVISYAFRYMYSDDVVILNFHSLSACGDLALGGFLGYYSFYSNRFLQFLKKLPKKSISIIYIFGILWMFNFGYLEGKIITSLFFAFIILEQNFADHSFFKFGNNRFFTFWGKYTYGLYLLHPIGLWLAEVMLFHLHFLGDPESVAVEVVKDFLALPLSFLISYFSYRYFERVFLKFKDKFNPITSKGSIAS